MTISPMTTSAAGRNATARRAIRSRALGAGAGLAMTAAAAAAQTCDAVSLSDVGWTDITVTTEASRQVLDALGYGVDVKVLALPVTFAALASNDLDVFLGNWMPSQEADTRPYRDAGTIEVLGVNLTGTKYNLAVPTYLHDEGLRSYADVADFRDALGGRIYGIEPGNEGNTYLLSLTGPGEVFEGFQIVESSEQGMLAQVARFYRQEQPVVFLGWEPHPMNANFDLSYLEGGEDFFGEAGEVLTLSRAGFADDCPNVARFFENQSFSLPMENEIMGLILDDGMTPEAAVAQWLRAHPETIEPWLEGVTTLDGAEGLPAVRAALEF